MCVCTGPNEAQHCGQKYEAVVKAENNDQKEDFEKSVENIGVRWGQNDQGKKSAKAAI